MKKFTLFAAFAALALSASAQYTMNEPWANQSVIPGEKATFDVVLGAEDVFTGLRNAGQSVNDWRVNNETSFLYVWDDTFVGGDGAYPGVGYDDFQYDGYTSLNVSNGGWSGAGFFFDAAKGTDTSHWVDATCFHVAYRSQGAAPASVAFVIVDGDNEGSAPAKVALGNSFQDGDAVYPTIGPAFNDEWQAVQISFADLKKIYPSFNYVHTDAWQGNMVSVLGGGVEGNNISIDCMYFFTPDAEGAVGTVADDAQWVITNNTVNVANGNGIQLYDLSGRMLKSSNSSVLGIDDLNNGVFIVKSGNSVKKIMK